MIEAAHGSASTGCVNVSSETVPGFLFAEREFLPEYCPVDEEHPAAPQDPYALAKFFGEQLCDAAVRRSDIAAVTVRPSWVQWEGNYERNVGAMVRDPSLPSITFWSYVDAYDLAELLALAAEATTPGHEVVYAAQPDNAGGRDLAAAVAEHYPGVPVRPLDRPDAGGIAIGRARGLLGWDPRRSWRDYLDGEGRARGARQHRRSRLARPRGAGSRGHAGPVSAVEIVEVGPRDGLQNEARVLPTEVKAEFLRRALAAGIRRVEAASFVNPRLVPQMADAEAVMAAVTAPGSSPTASSAVTCGSSASCSTSAGSTARWRPASTR